MRIFYSLPILAACLVAVGCEPRDDMDGTTTTPAVQPHDGRPDVDVHVDPVTPPVDRPAERPRDVEIDTPGVDVDVRPGQGVDVDINRPLRDPPPDAADTP